MATADTRPGTDVPLDVATAVARRASARAFLPDPVSEPMLRDLLSEAARAPSGGNLQPWHVHVLVGEPLAEFKALMRQTVEQGVPQTPEYRVYPEELDAGYRRRRRDAGAQRYRALGCDDRDPAALRDMTLRNVAFFGAPVGLFFCVDRRFGAPQWSDLGMYMQTLMLLAVGRGLDTCPQEVWSNWPDTLRSFLQLDATQMVFAGMSLGYRDPSHPLNAIRTERAPLGEFATLRGFTAA